MEEDGIQAQPCKFPRIDNGSARNGPSSTSNINNNNKIGTNNKTTEEINGELRKRGWQHHSSRIIRVPRASGGKDRHSKVMTSKGLRDRRVRLSVTTAIQFYDLQDRLGYDQPSKAVEWLIKAASDAISELPSLNSTFPESPKQQPSDEKRGGGGNDKCIIMDSADAAAEVAEEEDGEASFQQQSLNQNQNQNNIPILSKSACSSTSETSKGSGGGLSLSRSEIRVKARERARERAAKEKEKEKENENDECCNNNNSNIHHHHHHDSNNNSSDDVVVMSVAHTSSFTELLTGSGQHQHQHQHQHHRSDEVDLFNKGGGRQHHHQWSIAPMDYFNSGLLGGLRTSQHQHQHHQFSGQIQMGNSSLPHQGMSSSVAQFGGVLHSENNHHQPDQLHHFSFLPENFMAAAATPSSQSQGGSEYNLNFSISSSSSSCNDNNSAGGIIAGLNNNNSSRGTLQSNSPSLLLPHHLHHLQRSSPLDGSSNFPFFIAPAAMENHHHQSLPELDGRLQLCYGDASRHSDHKGKGKN